MWQWGAWHALAHGKESEAATHHVECSLPVSFSGCYAAAICGPPPQRNFKDTLCMAKRYQSEELKANGHLPAG